MKPLLIIALVLIFFACGYGGDRFSIRTYQGATLATDCIKDRIQQMEAIEYLQPDVDVHNFVASTYAGSVSFSESNGLTNNYKIYIESSSETNTDTNKLAEELAASIEESCPASIATT